ncbi:hypothetical protein AJ80_00570 [Polytolypa hystricis UAMH7299]|uniref:Transcription factor BYE1 n=1 Tax=Polytolypa hystricis (strain UAMH7299) TaxID=1447883 RepID=A0A2B7Z3Z8_POLH7|nr:hypothetical protein AJ80_00570 [Polytolypa hystricis UAMH7299]
MRTEEPRRSGRATKGQHTKNLDLTDAPPPKRKGKGQAKAQKQTSNEPTPAPEEEEDEIIRCICGEYEEEEDVERDMICCDKCSAWQHNDCMGLTFAKGEEPAEYFCEQCKPENHKELLDRMARGEKPWLEAAEKRAREAEERKARRKKGGKRGKKGKATDTKRDKSEDVKATATPTEDRATSGPSEHTATPVPAEKSQSSSQKRKFEEQGDAGQHEPEPKPKLQRLSISAQRPSPEVRSPSVHSRKASSATSAPPSAHKVGKSPTEATEGPSPLDHLSVARRNVANALVKLFVEQTEAAARQGTFNVPAGKTKETVGETLALAIEHAMYNNLCGGAGEPNQAYKQQMRTILFNVRKNPALRDSLLVGNTTPDALSKMSTQDMASNELRQRDDEIKRESERQHIIVQTEGPRIRRTHKGEELIEDENEAVGSEPIFSAAPRRDTIPDIDSQSAHSPGAGRSASPGIPHQPEFREYRGSVDDGQKRPLPIDTQAATGDRRTSSGTFNIQDVWSSVQSPATSTPRRFAQQPANRVQADAEIDQLLKDEEMESPPYSPQDIPGSELVWRGRLMMIPVAGFAANARYIAGADLGSKMPWEQLMPHMLTIDGRIPIPLATQYLCGLRFSMTTDVTVAAISPPESPKDNAEFQKLFQYFVDRERYGVVGKHPLSAVKDTYIIPVEAGAGKKPEFIELLENNTLEDPMPQRALLVVFVVKTSNSPSANPTPKEPSYTSASPLTATPSTGNHQTPTTAVAGSSISGSTPQTIPGTVGPNNFVAQGTAVQQPTPQSPQQHFSPPPAPQFPATLSPAQQQPQQQQQQQQPLTGKAAATQVLGHLANSPAVEELLRLAPNADLEQLKVVAGILAHNPGAANNYNLLIEAITKTKNGHQ